MLPELFAEIASEWPLYAPRIQFLSCVRCTSGYFHQPLPNESHYPVRWFVFASIPAPRCRFSLPVSDPPFVVQVSLQGWQSLKILSVASVRLFALLYAHCQEPPCYYARFLLSDSFLPAVHWFCCFPQPIEGVESALACPNRNPVTALAGKQRSFPKVDLPLFLHSTLWVYQLYIQHSAFPPEDSFAAAPAILFACIHRFPPFSSFCFVLGVHSPPLWR